MISNEERREVAARLRKCNLADGTSDVAEIEGIDEKFAARFVFVPNLVREIFPHDTKAVFSFHEIGDRLADLIDRPTTTRHGKFRTKYGRETPCCEICGYSIGDMRWNHCPKCGAVIADD